MSVGSDLVNSDYDISLENDTKKYYLKLEGGFDGIQEIPATPSTLVLSGGGGKWGDHGPHFGHIQQDTWHGGRGLEDRADDDTRYYDGQFIWTMTPGVMHQSLQWKWAETDHRDYNMHQPGSVKWQPLISTTRYISSKFTVAAQDETNYAADKAYIWLRRKGKPGTVTLELWTDSSDKPSAIIEGITKGITTSTVDDIISVIQVFDWTSTTTLTHATAYHVVVYGASGDNAANHWEVGIDDSGSDSCYSTAGSSWTAASYTMYYRVVDADAACNWHLFHLNGTGLYAVNEPATGNSAIYEWDETNDEWDTVGSLTGDAISGIVKSVAVSKDVAHMARGTGGSDETIFTFIDAGTPTGQDDSTATNKADVLVAYNDATDGPQIARFENDNWYWSRSDVKAINTDLVFGDDVEFPQGFDCLDMCVYNDQIYVRTTNGLWTVKNDRPSEVNTGLGAVVEEDARDGRKKGKEL